MDYYSFQYEHQGRSHLLGVYANNENEAREKIKIASGAPLDGICFEGEDFIRKVPENQISN